jgi:hypothetical protein
MAFFFNMHLDRLLECLPTCCSPDNPPRYEPFTYISYRNAFLDANYFHRKKTDEQVEQK